VPSSFSFFRKRAGQRVAPARPGLPVYAVQAAGASAIHDAWHRGEPVSQPSADTFADGLATRNTYPFTFGALREGLAGLVRLRDTLAGRTVGVVFSGANVERETLRPVLAGEL
jgi:threonine dehydratase